MNKTRSMMILLTVALGGAQICGCNRGTSDAPEYVPNSTSAVEEFPGIYYPTNPIGGISKELAVAVARRKCRSMIGSNTVIVTEDIEFKNGEWQVYINWSPPAPGSHMFLSISTNGSITKVLRGL